VKTPVVKISILFLLVFVSFSIVLFFFNINYYDQNGIFNYPEKKVVEKQFKKIKQEKYYVLNIENKVSSEMFLNLLYFLKSSGASYIIIDNNFINISDKTKIPEINDYLHLSKNIFSFLRLDNKKGISFVPNKKFENAYVSKNFIYLKTNASFWAANYLSDVQFLSDLSFKPERICVVSGSKNVFDKDNIDLLYKFNNKYLFSLPFAIYSYEKNINLSDVIFQGSKVENKKDVVYYDQKGRAGFISAITEKDISVNNILEWKNALTLRSDVLENLKKTVSIDSSLTGESLFIEEEKFIDSIYDIPEQKNAEKNADLNAAKNKVSQWKGFKAAGQEKINGAGIIIVQNGDFDWIQNFFYEKNVMTYGENLKKIPLNIIIIFSLFLFLAMLILGVLFESQLILFLSGFLFIFIEFVLYFLFRLVLSLDFPLISFEFASISGIIFGFLLQKYDGVSWVNEVKTIYKGAISNKFARIVSSLIKNKKWSFNSSQCTATFLGVDVGLFSQKDLEEEEMEICGEKIYEIESIIKSSYGILDNLTPNMIVGYFGNPPYRKEYLKDAINACEKIIELPVVFNNNPQKLDVAVHVKKEWFKFVVEENVEYYSHFGSTLNILSAMSKYAKKFGIEIIISDTVFKLSKLSLPVRMFDKIKISGSNESIRVFEYLTERKNEQIKGILDYYHAGLKLFEQRKWEEAGAYFRQCLKMKENDIPSQIFLQRCKDFIYVPPEDKWDGTYEVV